MTGHPTSEAPLVSLVMVTNRVSPHLREALQSVADQDYAHLELLVIDDGCPEPAHLTAILDDYPVRVIHQEPSGVSVGRNRGASLAQGTLLGFVDDDDRYPPDWVAAHVDHHRDDPQIILSFARVRSINSSGDVMAEDALHDTDICGIYRRDVQILAGSMLVRREAFLLAGGFNPVVRYAEDLDFVLRCAHLGPFSYVPSTARDYRTHEGNTTSRYRSVARSIRAVNQMHRDAMKVADRADLVRALRLSDMANDRYAFWRATGAARDMAYRQQPVQSVAEIFWAVRFAPLAPLDALRRRIPKTRAQ